MYIKIAYKKRQTKYKLKKLYLHFHVVSSSPQRMNSSWAQQVCFASPYTSPTQNSKHRQWILRQDPIDINRAVIEDEPNEHLGEF